MRFENLASPWHQVPSSASGSNIHPNNLWVVEAPENNILKYSATGLFIVQYFSLKTFTAFLFNFLYLTEQITPVAKQPTAAIPIIPDSIKRRESLLSKLYNRNCPLYKAKGMAPKPINLPTLFLFALLTIPLIS